MAVDADPTDDAVTRPSVECRSHHDGEGDICDGVDDGLSSETVEASPAETGGRRSRVRPVIVGGLTAAAVLGVTAGWLGYQDFQTRSDAQHRSLLVQAARQAAINLTTIDSADVDKNVGRIVDSAEGDFRTDFQSRATEFITVVKKAQSKSVGTVTESALESVDGTRGDVIVAVSVKTTTPRDPSPEPRGWRMRITVDQTSDGPKISKVAFVP